MTIDARSTVAPLGLRRRGVLGALGAGTVTAALAAAGTTMLGSRRAAAQAVTDADLFNFALNFEYLGAEYYLRGLTGPGPAAQPAHRRRNARRGARRRTGVPFASPAIAQYVQRLAVDELGHVQFIRAVLGAAAIAEPQIDLSVASWTTTAIAAGLITPGQTFNPYASDVGFLLGAYVIEDVCVTALAGAARFVDQQGQLEAAAGLLGVEGYQAGAIRTLLANVGARGRRPTRSPRCAPTCPASATRRRSVPACNSISPTPTRTPWCSAACRGRCSTSPTERSAPPAAASSRTASTATSGPRVDSSLSRPQGEECAHRRRRTGRAGAGAGTCGGVCAARVRPEQALSSPVPSWIVGSSAASGFTMPSPTAAPARTPTAAMSGLTLGLPKRAADVDRRRQRADAEMLGFGPQRQVQRLVAQIDVAGDADPRLVGIQHRQPRGRIAVLAARNR